MNVEEEQRLSQTLYALADPTRRDILRRLTKGEARVTALAEPFDISLNSVSKHIQTLERAGLVTRRRIGREHVLALNASTLDDVARWVEDTRVFWTRRLTALDTMLVDQSHTKGLPRDDIN